MHRRIAIVIVALLGCGPGSHTRPSGTPPAGQSQSDPGGNVPRGTTPPVTPKSLYDRLGGRPAVEAVVGEFVARLAADPRVKFRFANSNIPSLTRDLVDFVCLAAGGGCAYAGREMRILHASMHVTKAEWDATVEALVGALDKFAVPAAERGELLGAIGPLEADIVDPPSERPSGAELARIAKARGDLSRFGERAEILGAAFTALEAGQRGYADQLYSMAEAAGGKPSLARLAKLFRAGAPPRITSKLRRLPLDSAPQPAEAVGDSDADEPSAKPEQGSLAGTITLDQKDPKETFGVVTLTPVKGRSKKRTPKRRVVEQRGREFRPRLLAVPVGSTVAFPNFDDIYHNVFSRSTARAFDLGIFKNGEARELRFDREGIVQIGCNLHANMHTSIIVVSAPHYAVTDGNGAFTFKSLKPGTYTLRAWTERSAGPVEQVVEVKAGANQLAVDSKGGGSVWLLLDKFGAARGKSR